MKFCLMKELSHTKKEMEWAARVNGIYPEHLRACKTIKHYKAKIAEILQNADEIVGYTTCFDLEMLENSGLSLNLKQNVEIIDVMEMFAEYWGEWRWVILFLQMAKIKQSCRLV